MTPCRRAATSCCSRSFRRPNRRAASDTVYRAIKRLYNLNVFPEWWKLEPMAAADWEAIDALIEERDPYCRGVLLLGQAADAGALAAAFGEARSSRTCRGFAVGRTIFHEPSAPVAAGRHRRCSAGARRAREFRGADRRLAQRARRIGSTKKKGCRVSGTIRLTAAQALVRYLAALRPTTGSGVLPLFGGVFAIFGHGNVAGIGEALYRHRDALPTYRAHNEQAMAHAAIAYAKASMRRRMMACTTSIGPGATNLVTAAALAHVNRLPVLLLPGDVFVSRAPDPVLQQVEDFHDGAVSANDCFKPVSRYFDRIVHPAQLLTALPRAIHVLTDAALCGPVTLALPQDVQTIAYDYPEAFFAPRNDRLSRAAAR